MRRAVPLLLALALTLGARAAVAQVPSAPDELLRYADQCLDEVDAHREAAQRARDRSDDEAAAEADASAANWRANARHAFERYATDFPDRTGADDAMYHLAHMAAEDNDFAGMAIWLRQLIMNHPTSPWVPHAYVLFGDHFFAQGQLQQASKMYEKASQFPDAPIRGYALYKLGWCHLNGIGTAGPEGAKALQAFQDAIQASGGVPQRSSRLAYRKDLVRAYALVGKPGKAPAYFARVGVGPLPGEDDRKLMLDALEQNYLDRGDPASAEKLRRAIKRSR